MSRRRPSDTAMLAVNQASCRREAPDKIDIADRSREHSDPAMKKVTRRLISSTGTARTVKFIYIQSVHVFPTLGMPTPKKMSPTSS